MVVVLAHRHYRSLSLSLSPFPEAMFRMQSSICTYPAVGHRQLLTFRVSGADKAPWAVAESKHFGSELHRDRRQTFSTCLNGIRMESSRPRACPRVR